MSPQPLPIDLVRSIRRAFVDAPDLRLRLGQARCFWDASGPSCRAALRVLVDAGVLSRSNDGTYTRCIRTDTSLRPTPHATQWDCTWAVPVLADAPLWLHEWQIQWTCLKEDGPKILAPGDCEHCPRWEPRLGAHGQVPGPRM